MQVAKTFHELLKVVSGVLLFQSAAEGNEIEQLTATNKLKHDVLNLFACVLLGIILCSFSNFDHVNDIGMFDLCECVDLCLDEFLELLILV